MSAECGALGRDSRIPEIFYHGTSVQAAFGIQTHGFRVGVSGAMSTSLLGPGVYCTAVLEKAVDYSKSLPCGGAVLVVRCDLGRCKVLSCGDTMMKTWQQHGFDSAFAPTGANHRNMAENCIKDPKRVHMVGVFAGNTAKLQCMGVYVNDKGRFAMISDRLPVAPSTLESGKRKHSSISVDEDFMTLLRTWKLDGVASVLAQEGISDATVLVKEIDINDIDKIKIGLVFKGRLRNLVMHLVVEAQQSEVHYAAAVRMLGTLTKAGQDVGIFSSVFNEMGVMSGSASGQKTICTVGLVPLIVSVFKINNVGPNVIQQASDILTSLMSGGQAHRVMDSDAVAVLMGAIRAQHDRVGMLNQCLDVLHMMVTNEEHCAHVLEQVMAEKGVATFVNIMTNYSCDEQANRTCFKLLHAITKHSVFFLNTVAGEAMTVLLAVQTTCLKDSPLAPVGMQALCEMVKHNTSHRNAMVDAGGVGVVFECMGRSAADGFMTSECCSVLHMLSHENPSFTARMLECDGTLCLLSVLRGFGRNLAYPELVFNCCSVLTNVCVTEEVRDAMFFSGGIRLIMDALIVHKCDANVQTSGIAMLGVLSQCQKNLFEIAVCGGIDIILHSMDLHTTNVKLLVVGANTIQAMAIQHTKNVDSIIAKKGVATLFQSIRAHPLHAQLHARVVYVVGLLTREFKDQNSCTEFIGTMVKAVQTHPCPVATVEVGLYALTNIVTNHHGNGCAAIEAGLIPCLTKLMNRYIDHIIICRRGYQILRGLLKTATDKTSFLKSGGTEFILNALKNFTGEGLLFFTAFFRDIIAADASAFRCIGKNVLPLLHSIVAGHDTSAEPVHQNTRTLIASLACFA